MSNRRKIFSCASLFAAMLSLLSSKTFAQPGMDTTLKEVKIHGKHKISNDTKLNDFSPGHKIKTIDSATLQQYQLQSMANMLTQQTPVFVKSYGFNGLATLNFRGSSSAQSAVLWNGVPIQNAALGIADISTLPVLFMSKVHIDYGSSSALLGSGNVGGALLIENESPVFDLGKKSLSFSAGAGSFSQYMAGIKASRSFKRWYFSANVFVQHAENNFGYKNAAGSTVNLANSRLQSGAAMLQAAYKISEGNILSISAWYQQYERQIPPALFESYSDKIQTDGSLRTLLDWNKHRKDNSWYFKSSFTRDETHYRDDSIVRSDNVVYQVYNEAGYKRDLHQYGKALVFIPLQVAWLPQPDGTKQQDKAAVAAAYDVRFFNNKLDVAINGRAETIIAQTKDTTIQHTFFLPGVNASMELTYWLSLRGNVQRTYRTPTLNELYYFPGGNISLKPEQGWSEDGGYTMKFNAGKATIFHDLSLFTRDIHDWIYWFGGAIWTPHNIAEVHSRGVETENYITVGLGNTAPKWKLHLGVNTSYVLATTVASYIYNDGSIGKQIPYTPRWGSLTCIRCWPFTRRITE
jgi:vitamin B12 transporter